MDTFTVSDLRGRTGDLIRIALEGRLSLVTCHGKPVLWRCLLMTPCLKVVCMWL